MNTANDTLMEIVHLASAALVADADEIKRQAIADIADSIASIVPVERVSSASADVKSSETKRVVGIETPREPEAGELTGFQKFMTVSPGVTLVRFAGNEDIILQARRKGSNGNPNTIFSIDVSKELKKASVLRDRKVLFEIHGYGVGYNKVEAMAVSSLKRWFKDQRKHNSKRRRAAKLREGILTVAPGVTLVRFKGKDVTKLSARRVGRSGNPNTIFEVVVYHSLKTADIFKDGEILFSIHGHSIGHNKIEKIAVSALHRYLKDQRPSKQKRKKMRKGNPDYKKYILSTHEELARTVAEQKEVAE